jgi:hypothetical protein
MMEPLPPVAEFKVGAPGGVANGILSEVSETIPSPALVTANNWYLGELLPDSPEIVMGELVVPAETQLDHVTPLSVVERYL